MTSRPVCFSALLLASLPVLLIVGAGSVAADSTSILPRADATGCLSRQPQPADLSLGLVDTVETGQDRIVAAGSWGLILLGPVAGTGSRPQLDRLGGLNVRSLALSGDRYLFVLLGQESGATVPGGSSAGFAVIAVQGDRLRYLFSEKEPGTVYQQICLSGDHLYVAAQRQGLRIFDISRPYDPVLVGRLEVGLGDAQAVAVTSGRAAVADGEGGITGADVRQPATPRLLTTEDPELGAGATPDGVLPDHIRVASGGIRRR